MSAHPHANRHSQGRLFTWILVPTLFWSAIWILLCSSWLLNFYSYAWTHWISLVRPAVIELQIDGGDHPRIGVLAAQVRLAGNVLFQTVLPIEGASPIGRSQIRLPLRAFGLLEVRLATIDAQGCTDAAGIGRLHAAGEEVLAIPVQLFYLQHKYCRNNTIFSSTYKIIKTDLGGDSQD